MREFLTRHSTATRNNQLKHLVNSSLFVSTYFGPRTSFRVLSNEIRSLRITSNEWLLKTFSASSFRWDGNLAGLPPSPSPLITLNWRGTVDRCKPDELAVLDPFCVLLTPRGIIVSEEKKSSWLFRKVRKKRKSTESQKMEVRMKTLTSSFRRLILFRKAGSSENGNSPQLFGV